MKPQDFFNKYAVYAINAQMKYGVPASITLAQAALESAWGESGLTQKANNFFGIKDFPNDEWHSENYVAYTKEWNGSAYYSIEQPFRKYRTAQGSFDDHATFLKKNSRYGKLFSLSVKDFVSWATGLKAAGYATDPGYADKLISMVNKYGLSKYDSQAEVKKK
jgi:flagellum-specific peptidoglycan hydrolase FlgJ